MFGLFKKWRRKKTVAQPFPPEWEKILEEGWSLHGRLPFALQEKLKKRLQIFLAETNFEGLQGLAVTDEIRVLIAAQACLLLLGNDHADYHRLRSVLVYPGEFDSETMEEWEGGVVHEGTQEVDGESWDFGTVTLSWPAAQRGALNDDDGHNVVIHEFAHQLDQEDGEADGAPMLRARHRYAAWQHVFSREYERLRDQVTRGQRTVMDDYGATHPAEFFAVATECFFEKPKQLRKRQPELYEELKIFYGQDPVQYRA